MEIMVGKDKEFYETQLSRMKDAIEDSKEDKEEAHENADRILCNVLERLGYKELVSLWEQVGKYYS